MTGTYDNQAAAELLTDLAQRHGYSFRQLARLSGVHDRTVTNYANGERSGSQLRRPDPEKWLRIAIVFGPDDGAKLMEVCGFDLFAEALRRFYVDEDGTLQGLEFLPHFQRPRVVRIIDEVLDRAKGVSRCSISRPLVIPSVDELSRSLRDHPAAQPLKISA